MGNIVHLLEEWAAREPDRLLYAFLDRAGRTTESYSYASFHRRTNHLAAMLRETGEVKPGERVLLVYSSGLEVAAGFFACVKLGAVPVPVPPADTNGGMSRLRHVAEDAGATVALTDSRLLGRAWPEARLTWIATDTIRGEMDQLDVAENPLLFLQYTSGSTREPRGVMVTHANVVHNCHLALDHRPVGVSWLPHYHDLGMIGYYLWSLVLGGSAYCFAPSDFLRRPALWLETITKVRATITTVPNFAYDYCLRDDKLPAAALEGIDLSSLRNMVNAAEPVRVSTVNRFLERFAPHGLRSEALSAGYGLAEHTLCVTTGGQIQINASKRLFERGKLQVLPGAETGRNAVKLMSCGQPHTSIDVRIVEPATRRPAAEGDIGEIWVDSPSKAGGYWNKPGLTREVFDAELDGAGTGRTYLRTGDMGILHEGELYVCGRAKDMVVLRGQNIYPNDIEAFVEESDAAVKPGSVAAFGVDTAEGGEGLVVLVETRNARPTVDLRDLSRAIVDACGAPVHRLAQVPRGTIARTSSGKISRQHTRKRWLSGEVTPFTSIEGAGEDMPPKSVEDHLAEVFRIAEQAGGDDLTLDQLGLDSFELVTLSLHIEEFISRHNLFNHAMAKELNDLRIIQSVTVGQLRKLVKAVTARRPNVARIRKLSTAALHRVEIEEAAEMHRDMVLPADIAPSTGEDVRGAGTILLTGATGFLGVHLLHALLSTTGRRVVALVRAQDDEHARRRIKAAMVGAGMQEIAADHGLWSRVEALPGDIAEPRLGLEESVWRRLVQETGAIYHCAADVDYVKSYRAMRPANIAATEEIIRLACTGRAKRLHHVSTTFVFGWSALGVLKEGDRNAAMRDLDFGYAQSKWVAEQLVYQAFERGLDARVYRPSLITASARGHYTRRDIAARVLGYMIRHGITVDAQNQLSFLPVDMCARNIAAISLLDTAPDSTFHITTGRYYTISDVCAVIEERFGYPFVSTSLDGFIDHLDHHCGPGDELYPLVPFFKKNVERIRHMSDKRYGNEHYHSACGLSALSVPEPPLEDTVRWIVDFLQAQGLVPPAGLPPLIGDACQRLAASP